MANDKCGLIASAKNLQRNCLTFTTETARLYFVFNYIDISQTTELTLGILIFKGKKKKVVAVHYRQIHYIRGYEKSNLKS